MTIKKGDTLYNLKTGEPRRVLKTRKLSMGGLRAYLEGRDEADFYGDTLTQSRYSAIQGPELARLWADTLQARADEQAAREAQREASRLFRLANRDALNAPEIVTEPVLTMPTERGEVLIGVRFAEVQRDGLSLDTVERFHSVSVYDTPDSVVDENGNWQTRRVWGVNWSALGTQSPAVARAYAQAILAAADLAESRPAPELNALDAIMDGLKRESAQ